MDLPEVESARKGGAQMHPLLLQGSRRCYTKEKGELVVKTPAKELEKLNLILIRCVGSQGCHQTWAPPRSWQWILGHLAKCTYIDAKLRQKVIKELGSKAIGPATGEMLVKVLSQDSTGAAIEEIKPSNLTNRKGKGNGMSLTAFATNGGRKKQKEERLPPHEMYCLLWHPTNRRRFEGMEGNDGCAKSLLSPTFVNNSH